MSRAKTGLYLIHTDKFGNETRKKIPVEGLTQSELTTDDVNWVKRAISMKEYDDSLPEAGMGSGCW